MNSTHQPIVIDGKTLSPYRLEKMLRQLENPAYEMYQHVSDSLCDWLDGPLNELPRARYELHKDPDGPEATLWRERLNKAKAQYKRVERFDWFLTYSEDVLDLRDASDRSYLRECMDAVLEKQGRDAARKEADFALLCAWAGYSVSLGEYFAEEESSETEEVASTLS